MLGWRGIVVMFANSALHSVAAWETYALTIVTGGSVCYWRRGDGAFGIVISVCDLISLQKRPGVASVYWRRGDGALRFVVLRAT